MEIKYQNAIDEVYQILNFLDYHEVQLIPEKFWSFLEKNISKKPFKNISPSKPLHEQNISDEAKSLLNFIYNKYLIF